MKPLTREQVREVDRIAIQELGIPGVVLMENAGRYASGVAIDVLDEHRTDESGPRRVAILCGGGNNGGDGYVIARHLYNRAVDVVIYTVAQPERLSGGSGDAAVNHAICVKMGLPIRPIVTGDQLLIESAAWGGADMVIDALLGTGFVGTVRPHMAAVIEACNQLRGPIVLAVDLPSGLDCDTGEPSNATIRADVTVTFVAEKVGFAASQAKSYLGRVVVADIGTPPSLIDRVRGA